MSIYYVGSNRLIIIAFAKCRVRQPSAYYKNPSLKVVPWYQVFPTPFGNDDNL